MEYLWIGRSDYVVKAIDHENGQQLWNFTVSDITTPYIPTQIIHNSNVLSNSKNVFVSYLLLMYSY